MEDTWNMIMEDGLRRNIMLVPGKVRKENSDIMNNIKSIVQVFVPGGGPSPYLRASYSIADVEK